MSQGRIRRIPVQRRSRERVEQILRAAERIVVRDGVEALSTRSVATAARVPVASVYQYFADREAIIAALIERHVVAMDDQLAAAVSSLQTFSIRSLLEATVGAYVAGYAERPSYVALWFQGRVSPEIVAFVRARSEDLADRYHGFAIAAGLVRPDTEVLPFGLVAELIDSFLAIAYRDSLEGDARVVGEGIEMMIRYLEPYATAAGIEGISRAALEAPLDVGTTA
jgi:AcrR family transcriptional regulator